MTFTSKYKLFRELHAIKLIELYNQQRSLLPTVDGCNQYCAAFASAMTKDGSKRKQSAAGLPNTALQNITKAELLFSAAAIFLSTFADFLFFTKKRGTVFSSMINLLGSGLSIGRKCKLSIML
ncbi:hypothetical protein Ddc_16002 [Ditylenchus destructor]|nr:hypothetical protein Ddc_16002 [Ditylenchus destructor]